MNKAKKTFLDYGLTTAKGLLIAGGLSSAVLFYQASVLDKYNKILQEYNKIEKKDFKQISENLIDNYELEAAKDLVKYTIKDEEIKTTLLKKIKQKEESTNYKIDSLTKCLKGQSNGSDLSNYCNTGITFTPVGDVVDLIKEGSKGEDENVDKITVGLSVLGLAATVGAVYSGGTTLYVKSVVLSVKKLHKLDLLPKWFIDILSKIKSVDDVNDKILSIFEKLGTIIKATDLETAGKLFKSTKDLKQLDKLVDLVKKHPDDIKNFMKVSPNNFLKVYNKYGEKFDFNIYKQAFLIKGGFKMLEKQGVKGFTKSITKPKYPGTKVRFLKSFEKVFGKIANLSLFMANLLLSILASLGLYSGISVVQEIRKNKK